MGDSKWGLGEASDILITISDELNIIVPANDANLALYIEVPLTSIQEVSFNETVATGSLHPSYRLFIRLITGVVSNCMLNAIECAERLVTVAFASEKDANMLSRLLISTNVRTSEYPPPSQSEVIDVSEAVSSDDELAALGAPSSNRQELICMALRAHAIIPHGRPVGTINPSRLERVNTSYPTSIEVKEGPSESVVEHDDIYNVMAGEGIDVSQTHDSVEQAIEGINASPTDGASHKETQRHHIYPGVSDKASSTARDPQSRNFSHRTQEHVGPFERTSDNGLPSLVRKYTGLNAIQDAADFRLGPSQHWAVPSVKPIDNTNSYEGQNGEHDDLYYASPKVNDGQRRSPRILARNNNPGKLERQLEPTVRQAGVKIGPPTKLSRQLRNADGVVESNTEQAADDDFTTARMNGDVKTSANGKRSKVPVPAKEENAMKESKKPNKRMAPKTAIATEQPPNASFDDYDLPPSPTRVDSTIQTSSKKKKATATRPKANKAPHNNRKQVKPAPMKAAATTSLKDPASQLKKVFMNTARAEGSVQYPVSDRPSGKKPDDNDDTIWDVGLAHGEVTPQVLGQSRKPAETAKKQKVRATKPEKKKAQTLLRSDEATTNKPTKANTQATVSRLVRAKPAPAALSQPRLRRTAAIKANQKIQGLEESDEIVDDEGFVPTLTRSNQHASSNAAKAPVSALTRRNQQPSSVAAEAPTKQKIIEGGDNGPASRGKLSTAKPSAKNYIRDSISPDPSDEQRPDSVSDPKADSSPEKVHLVKGARAEAMRATSGEKSDLSQEKHPAGAAETSMRQRNLENGDHPNHPIPVSVEKGVEVSEARVNLVADSVPQVHETIIETELAPVRPQQEDFIEQGHDKLDTTTKPGSPRDKQQVQHALPYIDDVPIELGSKPNRVEEDIGPPQAPTTPTVVERSQRRTSPRLAEAARKLSTGSVARRRDPFGAKLNALMLEPRDVKTKVMGKTASGDANVESNGSNTLKTAKVARSSTAPNVAAFSEAKQENPRTHLKSAMQVDGNREDSVVQKLKPAGESISASQVKSKRKVEQIGNSSHKKVKLGPRELEGGPKTRKPADDSKRTPPVVSNKPLVIKFSATGPSNQGNLSTKKKKSPKSVDTGATSRVQLRERDVSSPTLDQVEAGFAPLQEAHEVPSEDIQYNADEAQKEAPSSPPRKPAKQPKAVNAIETRDASTHKSQAQKRKLAPFLDDPAPWEHEQCSKRQKGDVETRPAAHKYHPKMMPGLSPAGIHDRFHRVSSQNTRVNEKGSPMPFLINRDDYIAGEEQCSDDDDGKDALAEARLEEQIVLQEDDPILPEPTLPLRPLVSAVSVSQPKTTAYPCLSSNSKQVPSSPHAPSAFGTMPPHHIYGDGEIVNAETKESIIAVEPQDPFLGAVQNPQNPFMNAIRKSTELAAERLISGATDKKGSGNAVLRPSINVREDPDKTLVEPNLRKEYRQIHVSDSSTSSQSRSSTEGSQPYESSEEENDAETEAKWRKALEPHQENMLECLIKISHVSSHIDSTSCRLLIQSSAFDSTSDR